ncbi:tryptophan 7-halogenase [Sphingomonas sp. 3-13AW]|uniref:tryptophan 7-halogenase n=1 Tax=Sphingomonas sp. 3-13AW TaxID=3050450 RepID=UPI003BB6116A
MVETSAARPDGGTVEHIIVCGGGLAAWMTVATLARQLPETVRITFAETGTDPGCGDLFYGNASGPGSYSFNLAAGVTEPALVLGSNAAFSWGSKYERWSESGGSWIQCFSLPLPVIDGVLLHQYLVQQGVTRLDRFLMGAVAGTRGVFAHPPRSSGPVAQQPLARAEYGYHFDPASLARCFSAAVPAGRVQHRTGALTRVEVRDGAIAGIALDGAALLTADLYIDCTGAAAELLSRLEPGWLESRSLAISARTAPQARLGPPIRTVTHSESGWRAETPLRGCALTLTASEPDMVGSGASQGDQQSAIAPLGRRRRAWVGNCVGVGHAVGIAEPINPAPIMLLERDIERLVALIPVSTASMAVERREYDRRHAEDYDHAMLFTRAMFETSALPDSGFWRAAREAIGEKLERKLVMFAERGLLVSYDLEPFHPEDWTILHFGMGRYPRRHDRLADRADAARVRRYLDDAAQQVSKAAATLPLHHDYMTQFERYLRKDRR